VHLIALLSCHHCSVFTTYDSFFKKKFSHLILLQIVSKRAYNLLHFLLILYGVSTSTPFSASLEYTGSTTGFFISYCIAEKLRETEKFEVFYAPSSRLYIRYYTNSNRQFYLWFLYVSYCYLIAVYNCKFA